MIESCAPRGTVGRGESACPVDHHLYIWCGGRICQKREDDGETVVRSYYQNGFVEDSTAYNYTKDHLGSVWQVIDDDGETVTSVTNYSPWGEQTIAGAGPHSSFGYTGHLRRHEPTEVELAQYRGYDPRLGRWLNRDPIEEVGGINLHGYVGNEPVARTDPLGLECFSNGLPHVWNAGRGHNGGVLWGFCQYVNGCFYIYYAEAPPGEDPVFPPTPRPRPPTRPEPSPGGPAPTPTPLPTPPPIQGDPRNPISPGKLPRPKILDDY